MASVITAPTYDPVTYATALADKYAGSIKDKIANQTAQTAATAKALSSLSSALSSFQTSLSTLTGLGKSMLASSATLSDTSIGSATSKPQAAAGIYTVQVMQIATAGQVSYDNIKDGAVPGGILKVRLADETAGSTTPAVSFDVDLGTADTDSDGKLSVREMAAAINRAPNNNGQVSAGVVVIDGNPRLVMTSKNTGQANTISLDASAVGDTALRSSLATRTMVTQAQDAIIMLGGTNGTEIKQASNTFTNIDGVSLTVARTTDKPITLTVGSNDSGTIANVQAFVDAYNKLKTAMNALSDPGDPSSNTSAGAFAHDAGVQALQSRLTSILRPSSGTSLASFGIIANRDGTLGLDSARLTRQMAANPTGLDNLMGSANISSPTGLAGSLSTYLNQWTNSVNGQIKTRTDANSKQQANIPLLQEKYDTMYNSAYARYLKQFTDLQALQSTMNNNVTMFDALFGKDKS